MPGGGSAPDGVAANVEAQVTATLAKVTRVTHGGRTGIESTETMVAFRAFSKRDLDAVWDIGVD